MMAPTILIVDDEEKNLKLLRAMLSVERCEVVTAPDGETALKLIDEHLPDLILLDVMMPGMNGFDVCHRLKADARTQIIPVLMVTALRDKEDRVMALRAGADDFLSKPIDRTELLVRVKSLLRIKRYYDELIAQNRQIHEKNIELEELERLKESLYHMVVHDLRNPLMAISGLIEVLQNDTEGLTQNQANLLGICLNSCRELSGMIDSILDIYRLEHGTMELRKEYFDWKDLITQIEPSFRLNALSNRIQLNFSYAFESCNLSADRSVLARVVSNLLDNAIRHTPEYGSIMVFSEQNSSATSLLVSIQDSGKGIPKEYHHRIFEQFVQLPKKADGSRSGSCGLGLAFCKMAIEAHGGRIWVDSDGGGSGAKFCLELPT
jgi:signal transduction histidine kinase